MHDDPQRPYWGSLVISTWLYTERKDVGENT